MTDRGETGLTEEQAQTARFEPLIAAWLAYFDAMDRQNASGKAADAQIVRELRAKANSNDRRAADVIYQIALARHRASRGETGPAATRTAPSWGEQAIAEHHRAPPADFASMHDADTHPHRPDPIGLGERGPWDEENEG